MNGNGNGQHHYGDEPLPLRQLVVDLHKKMDDHSKKQDRINNVIFGDTEAKQDGLVQKVDRHSKYISTDKKIKWVGIGLAGSAGTGIGFWDTIKHFFGH